MAFTPIQRARHSLFPALTGRTHNDAAGFASCYGPHRRSPSRAFDAGLRPGPFPGQAASLLPGSLAITRTGLSPASGDELTDTTKHHGTRSRCHLPSCWAHRKSALVRTSRSSTPTAGTVCWVVAARAARSRPPRAPSSVDERQTRLPGQQGRRDQLSATTDSTTARGAGSCSPPASGRGCTRPRSAPCCAASVGPPGSRETSPGACPSFDAARLA